MQMQRSARPSSSSYTASEQSSHPEKNNSLAPQLSFAQAPNDLLKAHDEKKIFDMFHLNRDLDRKKLEPWVDLFLFGKVRLKFIKNPTQHQHELHASFSQMQSPLITSVPSAGLTLDKWENYLG